MVTFGCADWSGLAPQLKKSDPDELDVGASIRSAVDAANVNAKWPRSEWWSVFNDGQLNSLVLATIRDNPTQAIAAARVREAIAMAGETRAGTLPTLDGAANLRRRHWPESGYYNGGFGGQNTFDNTAILTFDYPLDMFGGRKNAAEEALDGAHIAAAEQRAAQLTLESNVVRAYVQLSLQYELRDVALRNLSDQQHVLDLAARRFTAGFGTRLDISEAQAPIPRTKLTIEQIQEAISLFRNQLAALTGKGPGAGAAIGRPTLRFDANVALPSSLPADLIGHRPDVVAMRWSVESQARAIDVAKASFYPNVDIMASGGGEAIGAIFSTFTRMSSMAFLGGPAISLPIFEGGRLRAGLSAASARYDVAVGQYNDTVIQALTQISNQVITFQSLEKQQELAEVSVSTAQKNYDLSVTAFKRGLIDYVNVLTSNDLLLAEQQSVKRVQAARFSAYAELTIALGGGMSEPSDSPAEKPPSIVKK
jgi:NodT family efflux transporter outer membrane factor (OMF) lipoprotein